MSDIVTNLHDMNKMLMGQLEDMTSERKAILVDLINELDDGQGRQYFMLLSNEKRDYTVFNLCRGKEETLGKEVMECLENRGALVEFDAKRDDGGRMVAIEIWFKDTFYALFPYDLGVIEC